MGSIGFWIAYCIGFGILGGGLYTYMSGRKKTPLGPFHQSHTHIYSLCSGIRVAAL